MPPDSDPRGVILAPNHESYLDPPLVGVATRRQVTYLAKEYLFRAFLVGSILRAINAFPIKSETDDFRSIREIIRLLKAGRCVVVFPEGTRSDDGKLREPEGGVGFLAVKSQAWVVPVYIDGTFEAYPKGAKFFKCRKVGAHFGPAFVPALDKALMAEKDPYMAVSRRIMQDIKSLQEKIHPELS